MTTQDIYIKQGADFQRTITLADANGQPLNVTGFSANAAMKIDTFSTVANVYIFQTSLSNGQVTITMWANSTINIPPGEYQYDVLIWNNVTTIRVMEGMADVDPGISQT